MDVTLEGANLIHTIAKPYVAPIAATLSEY